MLEACRKGLEQLRPRKRCNTPIDPHAVSYMCMRCLRACAPNRTQEQPSFPIRQPSFGAWPTGHRDRVVRGRHFSLGYN